MKIYIIEKDFNKFKYLKLYFNDERQIHMKWENGRTLALMVGLVNFI